MQFIITISYDLLCLASEEGVDQCWGRVEGGSSSVERDFSPDHINSVDYP